MAFAGLGGVTEGVVTTDSGANSCGGGCVGVREAGVERGVERGVESLGSSGV